MNFSLFAPSDEFLILAAQVLAAVTCFIFIATAISPFFRQRPATRHALWLGTLTCVLAATAVIPACRQSGWQWIPLPLETLHAPISDQVTNEDPVVVEPALPIAQNSAASENTTIDPGSVIPTADRDGGTNIPEARAETAARVFLPSSGEYLASTNSPNRTEIAAETTTSRNRFRDWFSAIAVAWLIGCACLLGRLVLGSMRLQRIVRESVRVDSMKLAAELAQVSRVLHWRSVPPIVESSAVSGPFVIGLVHPRVVLPAGLRDQVNSQQLIEILVHECAHIARHDHWVIWLQRLAEIVFWPHPLIYLMNARLNHAREEVCDNFVLASSSAPDFAETLLKVASLCRRPQVYESLAMIGRPRGLEERVKFLLDYRRARSTRVSAVGKITLCSLLLGLLAFVSILRPGATSAESESAPVAATNGTESAEHTDAAKQPENPTGRFRIGDFRLRPGGEVYDVAMSPDGKLVASGGSGPLCIWDVATGELVHRLVGHDRVGAVESLAFSPDGRLLATGGSDWTTRLWDVSTGKQLHMLRSHRYGMLGSVVAIQVAFTPAGDRLVTGAHDDVIQLWDVATGNLISTLDGSTERLPPVSSQRVAALAVSPDGKTVAAFVGRTATNAIRLIDLDGRQPVREIPVDINWVGHLKFSPDGKKLAWCGLGRDPSRGIFVQDLTTKALLSLPGDDARRAHAVDFSPDSRHVVSVGFNNTITLWDTVAGKDVWRVAGKPGIATCVEFSNDGRTIASGATDGRVRLWDASTGKERMIPTGPELDEVIALAVAPDKSSVLVGCKNGTICVRDFSGRVLQSFATERGEIQASYEIAFSPGTQLVAVGHEDGITLWETASGKRVWTNRELKSLGDIQFRKMLTDHVGFSRDGQYVIATSSDSSRESTIIRVWTVTGGELLKQINLPRSVRSVPAFSRDGTSFAFTSTKVDPKIRNMILDPRLHVYATSSGAPLHEFTSPDRGRTFTLPFGSVTFSPDGNLVASPTRGRIRFWNVQTGESSFSLPTFRGAYLGSLAFSPDGTAIAAAASPGDNGVTCVWNIADGRMTHVFKSGAQKLVFFPDGKTLLAAQQDGAAMVWQLDQAKTDWSPNVDLSQSEIERRWLELAHGANGNDEMYARENALVEGADRTVAFLEKELFSPNPEERDRLQAAALAAPLADANREVRLRAFEELATFGSKVWLELKTVKIDERPASEADLKNLTATLNEYLQRRRHGSVFSVLDRIGTPQAQQLLRRLANELTDSQENNWAKSRAQSTLEELERAKIRRPK